jgi:hypothetical protein
VIFSNKKNFPQAAISSSKEIKETGFTLSLKVGLLPKKKKILKVLPKRFSSMLKEITLVKSLWLKILCDKLA